jgi:hypothetical protein
MKTVTDYSYTAGDGTTAYYTIGQFINPTLGFFSLMTFDFEFMTKEQLDILFYANYGDKNPAPIVLKSAPLNLVSLLPSLSDVQKLAAMAEALYSQKWSRLKALAKTQYDPIHNYEDKLTESITDVGTGGNTTTGTVKDTGTDTLDKTNTRTDNLTNASQLTSDVTTGSNNTDSVYGFNSVDASNADKSVASGSENEISSNTITNTGTQGNVGKDINTLDKTKTTNMTVESHDGNDRTRSSTHSGNIGNLTTQQLMKQEIELWKWNFIQNVLADLCEFTTLPIYLS